MATAQWATPRTLSSNLASTTLDSLANGSTSSFVTYDNSTNLDLYATVTVLLGSLTPTTGGSITLRVYTTDGTNTPDNTGSVGGGVTYTQTVTTSTGAKVVVFPMVQLYPRSMRLQVTNNTGVSLAASSNGIYVGAYNESVA